MTYCMSDIHGCYNEFLKALELIDFKDDDTLFVIGDTVDRGPEPLTLLLDMMVRPNVYHICRNHDYIALYFMKKLSQEITEETYNTILTEKDMEDLLIWTEEGGNTTFEQFIKLSKDEREAVIGYMEDFSFYDEVTVKGKRFLMVHGGLEPFVKGKPIGEYSPDEMMFSRADYDKVYFDDVCTITGHTPTVFEAGNNGRIIKRNNHIAIDCGCVGGYNLAVYCLDTDEEFYVRNGRDTVL